MKFKTYDAFYAAVNHAVEAKIGLSIADLPDMPLQDWYEDDYAVEEAVEELIENAF